MNPSANDAVRPPRRFVRMLAPAKVNLHLEVLQRREDGYHDIETILQAVGLFDELTVELRETGGKGAPRIELSVTPTGAAPEDGSNLVWKAAALFCRTTGHSGHLRLDLTKSIPAEAGLGGGSSDAAATLIACNRLFEAGLSDDQLEEMGAKLGSDVPFFIRGGTQLGRGTGTDLTPLSPLRSGRFLIVKPTLSLRTASVYEHVNLGLTSRSPKVNIRNTEALIARFPEGAWYGHNRLEDVVLPQHPALQRLLIELRSKAPVAMLAGSGASVFAVFDDDRSLAGLGEIVDESNHEVHIVGPHPRGAVIKDD